MNRRQFLEYGTATAAAMVLGETATEPARLDVTTHRVALTAMPSVSLALVQISDLHLPYYGRHQRRIVTEAVANNPDVIVFTGDSIDRNDKLGVLDEFLSALVPSIPKFAILGNWEYWSDIDVRIIGRMYERHGVEMLVNRSTPFSAHGKSLRIVGFDDLVTGNPDVRSALSDNSPVDAELLLAHCPQQRNSLKGRTSLMLSGHTHGGQISMFGYSAYLPRGSGGYSRGWYGAPKPSGEDNTVRIAGVGPIPSEGPGDEALPPMYVSRGLGTSLVSARFCSIPELSRFELLI